MQTILTPECDRSLRKRVDGPWGYDYVASKALKRALDKTAPPKPANRPITTIDVFVDSGRHRQGYTNVGLTDVYKDSVEALVKSLSDDPTVQRVTVGGRTVYTRPTCTGGIDTAALERAVAS